MTSQTITEPILATKLHRPRITSKIVLRERLLDQLEAGRRRPLTLVSASAGYGKSNPGWSVVGNERLAQRLAVARHGLGYRNGTPNLAMQRWS